MNGLAGAWLVGEGIVIWRRVHQDHKPPNPGALLAVTGLFALAGAAAGIFPRARTPITLVMWGLDVAGVLNLWPAGLGGQVQQAAVSGASTSGGTSAAGGGA